MAKAGSERHPNIDSLKERIARDPLSRAFLQLAEEYRRLGRFKEAVEVCLEGLGRHPTYHTARISLGRTYMEAGDLANARRAFSDVLELQPENHLAGKLLAEVQKKTGDLTGAAETYRAILGQYPNDREVEALLRQVLGGSTAPPAPSAAAMPPAGSRVAPAMPAAPAAPRSATPVPAVQAPPAAVVAPRTPVSNSIPPMAPAPPARDPAPDFRVEDLGGAGFPVAGETVAPGGPLSAPALGAASFEEKDGEDALQTNTLAELYLRQGLVDRAIEVYRGMLRVDPGHLKAARRLNELLAAGVDRQAAPVVARVPDERPPATMTPPRTTAAAPARDQRIVRLERWLEGIRAVSSKEASTR